MPKAGATTSYRPEESTVTSPDFNQGRQPTTLEYYTKNLAIGVLGEGVYRRLGLKDTLSFRKLEEVTGWKFPSAKAEEVLDQPAEGPKLQKPDMGGVNSLMQPSGSPATAESPANSDDAAPSTGSSAAPSISVASPKPDGGPAPRSTSVSAPKPDGGPAPRSNAAHSTSVSTPKPDGGPAPAVTNETAKTAFTWRRLIPSWPKDCCFSNATHSVSTWAVDNKEWLLLTGGIALTSAAINHASSRFIRNDYARNLLSLATGTVVVWGVSNYGLRHAVNINEVSDIALRLLTTAATCKIVIPVAQSLLQFARVSMAYPVKASIAK